MYLQRTPKKTHIYLQNNQPVCFRILGLDLKKHVLVPSLKTTAKKFSYLTQLFLFIYPLQKLINTGFIEKKVPAACTISNRSCPIV